MAPRERPGRSLLTREARPSVWTACSSADPRERACVPADEHRSHPTSRRLASAPLGWMGRGGEYIGISWLSSHIFSANQPPKETAIIGAAPRPRLTVSQAA